MPIARICVFCGSNSGFDPRYRDAARELGRMIATRDIGLVYGGGCIGLMGMLADAVLDAGGHVTGVIPHQLAARELAHRGIQDLRIVTTMHERKAMMADLSAAFIALPGGFGTFEEFCEMVTWSQLGLHRKRCGLLNIGGFYGPLLALFDRAAAGGFIKASNLEIVTAATDAAGLLEAVLEPLPVPEDKWIRDTAET